MSDGQREEHDTAESDQQISRTSQDLLICVFIHGYAKLRTSDPFAAHKLAASRAQSPLLGVGVLQLFIQPP